jgi:ABC-2 type transport system permease protein
MSLRRARSGRPPARRLLAAQIGYQLRVLVRSPLSAFATLIVPLMVLLAVGLLYKGTHLHSRGDIAYVQFFTPAMVAFAVVTACYTSVISSVTLARDEGILKRVRSTPLPPWIYMAGRVASASIVALLSAVVVIAVGAIVYNFEMIWSAVPAALVVLLLAMFCFCAIALAVTVLVPHADAAFPIAWGSALALCFVSDVFLPIGDAPRWLRDAASVLPLRPLADDLESAFNPVRGTHALHPGHLAVLAAWGLVASVFALVAFRWEPSTGASARRPNGGRTAFAIERVRSLFAERVELPGLQRRAAGPRDDQNRSRSHKGPARPDDEPAAEPQRPLDGSAGEAGPTSGSRPRTAGR